MKDFYRVLGVSANAHDQDIKLAYRRLAKQFHPDLNPGDKNSEDRFKEIVEAYDTLSDPILRATYDRKKSGRDFFYTRADFFGEGEKTQPKDPRKKEYSEEDLERARKIHRRKALTNMAKRKKIFVGMVITFIFYIIGSGWFEHWIEQKRKDETDSLMSQFERNNLKNQSIAKTTIENVDSPYDQLFGEGVYVPYCPNAIVIFNHFSDAIICLVQANPPFQTIRNEFAHAEIEPIVLRDLPNGSYYVKIYAGSDWNMTKKTPNGSPLGGFSRNESFFRIHAKPITLVRPTHEHAKNEHFMDTIWVDPKIMGMDSIGRADFFDKGQ